MIWVAGNLPKSPPIQERSENFVTPSGGHHLEYSNKGMGCQLWAFKTAGVEWYTEKKIKTG
jgi:hypothetical protein